jgi:hypothetical protein
MAGSKKGEHRGNARKRPPGHETPNEIMRKAARRKPTGGKKHIHGPTAATVEDQIMISRVINGDSGRVRDMTPKEIMLDNMWTFMQGALDYQEMWRMAASVNPPTQQSLKACELAEREIERLRLMAGNAARDVMPVIHPRLSAIAVTPTLGDNEENMLQALLDEVDRRQREAPPLIEHAPQQRKRA